MEYLCEGEFASLEPIHNECADCNIDGLASNPEYESSKDHCFETLRLHANRCDYLSNGDENDEDDGHLAVSFMPKWSNNLSFRCVMERDC